MNTLHEGSARQIAYLGLGGNVGDPVASMSAALRALDVHAACRILRVSRLYRTPPWGNVDQDWFFNAAASVETSLAPEELLDLCLSIEQSMKRVRDVRWGPRTIDIDVLAYGDLKQTGERLTLPHPRMTERAFVLMPMADIAPDLVIDGREVREWLRSVDIDGIEIASEEANWWRI